MSAKTDPFIILLCLTRKPLGGKGLKRIIKVTNSRTEDTLDFAQHEMQLQDPQRRESSSREPANLVRRSADCATKALELKESLG